MTPTNPSVALGLTQQFTATGTYSDGTTQDLTSQVTWSTSDTSVATVSNAAGSEGLASTVGVGAVTVTATDPGTGETATTTLTVTNAVLTSLAVTPENPSSIAVGRTQRFKAIAVFSDGSTQDVTNRVVWSSSNTAIATVANAAGSKGLVTTVSVGATTLVVSDSATGLTASTTVTVDPVIRNRAYVVNAGTNSVTAIDTVANAVVKTIPTGPSPKGVAIFRDANRAFVTNAGSDTISVVNTATNAVVSTISLPIGSAPRGIVVDPTTERLYVANSGTNTLAVIDISDAFAYPTVATISVGSGPWAVDVDTVNRKVYVANALGSNVSVVDASTNTVVNTIPVGQTPRSVVVSPAIKRAYVANYNSDTVTVIDIDSDTVVTAVDTTAGCSPYKNRFECGKKPSYIAVQPLAQRFYVSNTVPSPSYERVKVVAYDTATNLQTNWWETGDTKIVFGPIVVDQGVDRLYVSTISNVSWYVDTIVVFDTNTLAQVASIPLTKGANPVAIALTR